MLTNPVDFLFFQKLQDKDDITRQKLAGATFFLSFFFFKCEKAIIQSYLNWTKGTARKYGQEREKKNNLIVTELQDWIASILPSLKACCYDNNFTRRLQNCQVQGNTPHEHLQHWRNIIIKHNIITPYPWFSKTISVSIFQAKHTSKRNVVEFWEGQCTGIFFRNFMYSRNSKGRWMPSSSHHFDSRSWKTRREFFTHKVCGNVYMLRSKALVNRICGMVDL